MTHARRYHPPIVWRAQPEGRPSDTHSIKFARWPADAAGHDPCSFIQERGAVALTGIVGSAPAAPSRPLRPSHWPAYMLPPLPTEAETDADHDRAWDIIEAHAEAKRIVWVGERPGIPGRWERSERWHTEVREAWETAMAAKNEEAQRARDVAALDRMMAERERLVGENGGRRGADPHARASAYLSRLPSGSGGAWTATLAMVRGFALGADEGAALVVLEFAPRYHRKLLPREVRDMARRAMRATVPWAWLLTAGRR